MNHWRVAAGYCGLPSLVSSTHQVVDESHDKVITATTMTVMYRFLTRAHAEQDEPQHNAKTHLIAVGNHSPLAFTFSQSRCLELSRLTCSPPLAHEVETRSSEWLSLLYPDKLRQVSNKVSSEQRQQKEEGVSWNGDNLTHTGMDTCVLPAVPPPFPPLRPHEWTEKRSSLFQSFFNFFLF